MKIVIIEKAEIIDNNLLKIVFSKDSKIDKKKIKIINKDGNTVEIIKIAKEKHMFILEVERIDRDNLPYKLIYENSTKEFKLGFSYIDELYAYDGNDLGATLHVDGTATLKLWSPLVKDVEVILYDKNDGDKIIADNIPMTQDSKSVWTVTINKTYCDIENLDGYYYNYKIDSMGTGDYKLALDPYAKSMWTFDNKNCEIGKGAIINPSKIGPKLAYANIPNFQKREDAIIWEIHTRDFTVDPSIEGSLNSKFGTFKAFIDKLDYIKDLGVTHIQLLPIMSYYLCNEFKNSEREMFWSSRYNNYNWGYDPHSYFSVSGMYSENPNDPELRIAELKELINAIHSKNMGIILDVVYNHTGNLRILEDLAPNYYHFTNIDGSPKTAFGGGILGTTHFMTRKLVLDSVLYWTKEFKVDGFRFDMMGDHDSDTIQMAYEQAKEINPNLIMIGEGWRTYHGDDGDPRRPADQDWMAHTDSVGVFSDEFRDELKSGYNSEGEPRFITGGKRNIGLIFDNLKANPHNFVATSPGDVVPYIEAHDNLTLHDVIAQSIKKDPEIHEEEIHKRIRIGNAMCLTAQGTAFLHGGQEYGRSKQWKSPDSIPTWKETFMEDAKGVAFKHPYFIHDTYDSTDIINMFNWDRATNQSLFPISTLTRAYTTGLINLRKSTDAFRLGSKELIDKNINLIYPTKNKEDLIISYSAKSTNDEKYYIFINADTKDREFPVSEDLTNTQVIVDEKEAGISAISNPTGVRIDKDKVILAPLTVVILKK